MNQKIFYLLSIIVIVLVAAGVYFVNPFDKKLKSGLQVKTFDTPASLFLNGQYLDKSPFIDDNIMPGNYQLKIVPDDSSLASYELPIVLNQGLLTAVVWKPGKTIETSGGVVLSLEPLPSNKNTEVSIVSNPDGALVTFDELKESFTPTVIKDVEPGNHELEIALVSFDSNKNTVKVIEGHKLNVFIKLAKSSEASLPENADKAQTETNEAETIVTQPAITITATNFFQGETEVLRVRKESSLTSEQVGFITVNQDYHFTQEENGWYFVEFEDPTDNQTKQGWINGEYAQVVTPEKSE